MSFPDEERPFWVANLAGRFADILQEEMKDWAPSSRLSLVRIRQMRADFPVKLARRLADEAAEGIGPLGSALTEGAGPDDTCSCGEPITMYEGEWLHIYSEELRGTGDHEARPG